MNNKRCVLLPYTIGDRVIKISLDNSPSENARVILFVPPNGCVYQHSHDKDENLDSEVYIDLLQMLKTDDRDLSILPEVAGSNSPTGRTIHGIEKREYPQIILAIKKGQEEGIWEDFNSDFERYFQTLGVTYMQSGDKIKITSNGTGEKEESIIINTKQNSVTYFSKNQQEFATLVGLQDSPKPKDEESKSKD